LSSDQKETIKAHDTQIMNGSLSFIPKDVRDKIAQKYHQIKSQGKDSESRTNAEPAIKHLIAKAEPIIAPLKPKAAPIAPLKAKATEEPKKSWAEDKKWRQYPSFAEAVKKERDNVKGTNLHAPKKL
jgi:hypothetical protein